MKQTLAINGGPRAVSSPLNEFSSIGIEERNAVIDFMSRGSSLSGFHGSSRPTFFGGKSVQKLEAAWSEYFEVEYSVSMNSATSGLIAAMGAIGVEPGDEVIVPPMTMSATAMAPLIYGAVPVFVDIEPEYFCLDVKAVTEALTPRTKAICVVNLFGHPAELMTLRKLCDRRGIFLIEDNSQAIIASENGSLAGTVGHVGVYSLNVHKHIHSGEGGVCVTDNSDIAKRLQIIRNHGENVLEWFGIDEINNLIGFNFRLPEISAEIALCQLSKVESHVTRVEDLCNFLSEELKTLTHLAFPKVRPGCRHNYYMWSVQCDFQQKGIDRKLFCDALNSEGFPVSYGYVPPLYKLPTFQKRVAVGSKGWPFILSKSASTNYKNVKCVVAENLHYNSLIQFQPVSWAVDKPQRRMLVDAMIKVYDQFLG